MSAQDLITQHQAAGRYFKSGGVRSFVREQGRGETVVCMHGVPASSFLYRKVLPELASRGFNGIAFDLPGMGLADRPADFDYSFSGSGQWSAKAIDDLGIDKFHLVIHDIGGPVGLEILARMPERVLSLTVLNTLILVDGFKKPWMMRPFGWAGINKLYLAGLNGVMFKLLMNYAGVYDKTVFGFDVANAYVQLLKREDRGAAFLKFMQGFETTAAKQAYYLKAIAIPTLLIQAVDDPFMTAEVIPDKKELSEQITMEITQGGGHVGFVTGVAPFKPRYWLEQRIPEFLHLQHSRLRKISKK